jgi:8-oxo-dGTP pyrophosphatase MutT (NUDIX family)
MDNVQYCNNCGKPGHLFHQCKMPITSIGIIAFRVSETPEKKLEYLLIRRKDTLGYIDFMRGKYSVQNKEYIMNMVKQMTKKEKDRLKTEQFDVLWRDIWGSSVYIQRYKSEEGISREKFNSLKNGVLIKNSFYTLSSIIDECTEDWEEPEWGFPKGRRNSQENDYNCAIREFCEETGYSKENIHIIKNVIPYEENFTGSNYKSYKHKYFLVYMNYEDTLNINGFQKSEVSMMTWKSIDETLKLIRPYNLEKKNIIMNIDKLLNSSDDTKLFYY